MTLTGWIQIVVVLAVLTGLTPLLGGYMARVYQGNRVALTPVWRRSSEPSTEYSSSTATRSRRGRSTPAHYCCSARRAG